MLMHKIRIEAEHEQAQYRFQMDLWGNWMAAYLNGFKKEGDDPYTVEDFYPRNPESNKDEKKISESDLEAKMKMMADSRKRNTNG